MSYAVLVLRRNSLFFFFRFLWQSVAKKRLKLYYLHWPHTQRNVWGLFCNILFLIWNTSCHPGQLCLWPISEVIDTDTICKTGSVSRVHKPEKEDVKRKHAYIKSDTDCLLLLYCKVCHFPHRWVCMK